MLRRTYFPLQVRAGLGVPKLDKAGKPVADKEGAPVMTGKYGFHQMRHAAASGWIANLIDLKRLQVRSEEQTSELQSLLRNSYTAFCWKKKTTPSMYIYMQTKC